MSAGLQAAAAATLLVFGGVGFFLLTSGGGEPSGAATEDVSTEVVSTEAGSQNTGNVADRDYALTVAPPPSNLVDPTNVVAMGSSDAPRGIIQRPPPSTNPPGEPVEPVRVREPSIDGQPIPPPPAQLNPPPTVDEVEPQRLSPEEFRESVRTQFTDAMPAMRDCYDQILELSPDLSDRLLLNVEVSDSDDGSEFGRSSLQSIDSSDLDIEETACFAEVVEGMQFPAPDNEPDEDGQRRYNITYPVALSAE